MKKFLISIFAVFALTVGLFLPTVANRNITAKADSSALINDDTVNYIEELLERGESITDKWLRFSASESLVTDNLTFNLAAGGYISISKTENAASMTCNTIISKVQFGMVEMYIPSGSIAVNPLLGDVPIDSETKKFSTLVYKLIKPETPIDNVTGTHLEWEEKELMPGDSITGRWLRLFNQNKSATSGEYGIKLSESYYLTNSKNVLIFGKNMNNIPLDKFEKIGLWGFIDIYIPENAKVEFFDSTGSKVGLFLNTLTVNQADSLYAVAIEPPAVEEPDEPIATPEKPVKVEYVNKSDALPAGYKPLKAGDVITSGTIAVYRDSDDDFDVAYMRSADNNVVFFPAMPGGFMLYGAWNGAEDLNSESIIDAEYLDINYDTWNIIAVEDFGEITILEGEKTIYYKPNETPGESDVESIVESNDIVQSATDWINSTLGLSLSTGALIVILVILFVIFKK